MCVHTSSTSIKPAADNLGTDNTAATPNLGKPSRGQREVTQLWFLHPVSNHLLRGSVVHDKAAAAGLLSAPVWLPTYHVWHNLPGSLSEREARRTGDQGMGMWCVPGSKNTQNTWNTGERIRRFPEEACFKLVSSITRVL